MIQPRIENADRADFRGRERRSDLPQPFALSITAARPCPVSEVTVDAVEVPAEFNERTVLIDLNQIKSIDSWGIALFIEALQHITAHGGHLALIGIHDDVRRVFETTKLDQVFHIFPTREEALADHSMPLARGDFGNPREED